MAGRWRRDATGATTPRRHEARPAARRAPWTAVNRPMGTVLEFQRERMRNIRATVIVGRGRGGGRGGCLDPDRRYRFGAGGQSVDPDVNAIPSGGWVGWAEGRGRTRS
jgi:hypothetical protein